MCDVNVNVNVNLGNVLFDNTLIDGRRRVCGKERHPRTRAHQLLVTRNAFKLAICGTLARVFAYGPVSMT